MRNDGVCCAKPRLTVRINGYEYTVERVEPEDLPACASCATIHDGPWRVGPVIAARPGLCGRPTKKGTPCKWRLDESECPNHLTPEQEEQARLEREEKERLRQQAEEERQVKRAEAAELNRQFLALIFSVACPRCAARAAEVCVSGQGKAQRGIHALRRRLAGVTGPKEFVLFEKYSYYDPRKGLVFPAVPAPPPLDADLRQVLADPLEDWTERASAEWAEEQRLAAEKKALRLQRDLWRLSNDVTCVDCPVCDVVQGQACVGGGAARNGHDERVDAAMARAEPVS
jgi:hypothetical protein